MSLVDEARTVRQRIADRLAELEPLVREYAELQELAAEMGLEQKPPPSPAGAGASSSTARASSSPSQRSNRVRRPPAPKGDEAGPVDHGSTGELAQRVLEAVRSQPGKTVADYAIALDVAPTALYRPVRQLTTSGALVKRARQLFPG